MHLALNYEMNLNLFMYEREVYTTLDWFGNIGGLAQGLQLFFGAILAFLNYKYYNNYMVAKLFTYKQPQMTDDSPGPTRQRSKKFKRTLSSSLHITNEENLDAKQLSPFVLLFHELCPLRCAKSLTDPRWYCCRKTERYRVFEDGN